MCIDIQINEFITVLKAELNHKKSRFLTRIIHEILFMQIQGTEFRRHILIFQGIRNEVDA